MRNIVLYRKTSLYTERDLLKKSKMRCNVKENVQQFSGAGGFI